MLTPNKGEVYKHAAAYGQTVQGLGPVATAAIAEVEALTDELLSVLKEEKLTMGKDPLSGALSRSLQDEDTAVEQRFASADSILGGQGKQRAVLPATPAPPSKERAVRATFTLAEADSELLPALQQRCLEGRHSAARSEIVRAGLRALAQMQAKEFLALVKGVEKLKPGPGKRVQ